MPSYGEREKHTEWRSLFLLLLTEDSGKIYSAKVGEAKKVKIRADFPGQKQTPDHSLK